MPVGETPPGVADAGVFIPAMRVLFEDEVGHRIPGGHGQFQMMREDMRMETLPST